MFHRVCHFQLLHKLQENSKDRILKSWGFFKYDLSVSVTPCFGRFLRMQMRKCSKNHCVRKPFVRVFLCYGTLREHFIHTFFIRLKRAFQIKDENIHCKQRVITIISHFSIFALIESGNQHSKYIAHDFYQQQKRKEMFAKLAVADDANERKANNTSFIRASLPHFVKLQKYLKHFPVHYFSSI